MSAQPIKQWGQTAPISTALPTDKEKALNESLIEELKQQNNFASTEETDRRVAVLQRLQKVTEEFVREVARKKNLAQSIIDNGGGKIFTFGSYRLGVYGPGSDIDTLVVGPKHVTREDFFEHFPSVLERLSDPGAIEELTPVPEANVPIIKLEYSGISVDLIYSPMATLSSVPKELELSNKDLLRGLDDTDLKSVNGVRVTDEILALVPQEKTFRHALRAIKLWANRRAVYANVMGFPGGVAWAMMVARVCQLYPMATGSTLVSKFFYIMKGWPWPRPVMLKDIESGPFHLRVWNPEIYPGDKRHLMPVITPAFPSMCSTHNITPSTRTVVQKELDRASAITDEIFAGKKTWADLFERHTFFTQDYKYYLSIISASRTKEANSIWSGYVQSRVRRLVTGIEQSGAGVAIAHPFNKGYERVHRCKESDVDKVLQGDLSFQVKETETTDQLRDIKQSVAAEEGCGDKLEMPSSNGLDQRNDPEALQTIWTVTYYLGIGLEEGAKSLDISYPVSEFKRLCTEWQQFDEELNSLRIIHTRAYDLPEDVFEAGEIRPTKTKKVKSSNRTTSQKRSMAEAGIDGTSKVSAKRQQSTNGVSAPAG